MNLTKIETNNLTTAVIPYEPQPTTTDFIRQEIIRISEQSILNGSTLLQTFSNFESQMQNSNLKERNLPQIAKNPVTKLEVGLVNMICDFLKLQEISNFSQTDRETRNAFSYHLALKTYLNFEKIEIKNDADLQAITQICPNLTDINLDGKKISNHAIEALAQKCPSLTSISLRNCQGLRDEGLLALAKNCPQLAHVDLQDCENYSENGLIAFIQNCPHLTTLNLQDSHQSIHRGPINDINAVVSAIAENCPQLISLNLAGCKSVLEIRVFPALAQNCPHLIHLNLARLDSPRLTNEEGLIAFLQNCPQLLSINLKGWDCIDNVMRALGQYCPLLRSIILDNSDISDIGLEALVQGCRSLVRISLENCTSQNLTQNGIKKLGRLPELTSINLKMCVNRVTDSVVQSIAKGCPLLTDINLSDDLSRPYSCITDEALEALAQGCPRLSNINVSNCYKITDRGLKAIIQVCPLKSIEFDFVGEVTEEVAKAIVQSCPDITYFTLVRGMSDAMLETIEKGCKNLPPFLIKHYRINRDCVF